MKFNLKKIIEFIFPINELKSIFRAKVLLAITAGCLFLLILCLILFIYQFYTPLSKGEAEEVFVIEEGQNLKQIAQNLRIERIIGSKWVFITYVFLEGKTENLQAGKYNLSSDMNIIEVAEKIIKGEAIKDWVKVTFPEGWANKQVEEKLAELGVISFEKRQFFTISTESFLFLADKPTGPNLQGYLFPDTYYFEKESTIEEVVKKMLRNFGEKLTQDLREEIKQQEKTIYEIVTMASIVQNEVSTVQDMSRVAGIFYNRLKLGIPLQSDATVNYVTGKKLRQPLIEDTKIESPYNTYLNPGLPPGPISNPGLEAIKAAIYPEETDYMYFLNPLDGKTIFSKTFEEHSRNKAKYLQ